MHGQRWRRHGGGRYDNVTGISIACLINTTILYSLAGYPGSGANPYAALIQGGNGNLYGTTEEGGSSDLGTLFVISPANGTETLLHPFVGSLSDGANPYSGLIKDSAGTLYGTTEAGGAYRECSAPDVCYDSYGTVFRINPTTGAETLLYSFKGNIHDGSYSYSGVILASDGYLFGTTQKGGTGNDGTVFRINASTGAELVVHSFAGGAADGALPYAGLLQASGSNLYGTTQQGGASGDGTVFQVNPSTNLDFRPGPFR